MSTYFRCLRRRYLSLRKERYRRKTRQRAPKPPFGFWLFIRGFGGETYVPFYVFALVQFTRLSQHRRSAYPRRFSVLHVLRQNSWHLKNNQRFSNLAVGWLRKCSNLSGKRSTQRQGNKRSAPQGYLLRGTAADLIASNAPLRGGAHKARQNTVPH